MKNKKILYVLLCLFSGCMIGLNAGNLYNMVNIALFTFAVAVLVYSIIKVSQ